MAEESSESGEGYELSKACRAHTPEALGLVVEIVKKAKISMNQGGTNIPMLNIGLKAASTLLAYGHGMPTANVHHTGVLNQTTVNVQALSTEALRELAAARKMQKQLPESKTFESQAVEVDHEELTPVPQQMKIVKLKPVTLDADDGEEELF